ncbi:hypothetical protein CVT24_000165 [Panaeolus cyanescens]|uniref:ER transporter 6TM N-terminal domain-containing protein n=1 Tax=Panaeolus cyanescens TaxID=181874 RepID=A0A409W394_9AGAR|nr:hypothetical protein CVT24_000165 [Panaeolus cyanescens]
MANVRQGNTHIDNGKMRGGSHEDSTSSHTVKNLTLHIPQFDNEDGEVHGGGDGDGGGGQPRRIPDASHSVPSSRCSTSSSSSSSSASHSTPSQSQTTSTSPKPPAASGHYTNLKAHLVSFLKDHTTWITSNLTWSRLKPAIRCAVAGWLSAVLFIIPEVLRVMGQASFLILIASFFSPPSDPFLFVLEREFLILFFAGLAWAWSCLGIFLANLARRHIVRNVTIRDVVDGRYIEARPTVILAVFVFLGSAFFLYIKAKKGPSAYLFACLFACICMDISLTTAAFFPFPFYLIGRSILVPLSLHSALALLCSIFIFPSTVSALFTTRIIDCLDPLNASLKAHRALLDMSRNTSSSSSSTSSPSTPTFSLSLLNTLLTPLHTHTKQAEASLIPLAGTGRLLGNDVIYARIGPKDWGVFQGYCRRLVGRLDGVGMFWGMIGREGGEREVDGKGGGGEKDKREEENGRGGRVWREEGGEGEWGMEGGWAGKRDGEGDRERGRGRARERQPRPYSPGAMVTPFPSLPGTPTGGMSRAGSVERDRGRGGGSKERRGGDSKERRGRGDKDVDRGKNQDDGRRLRGASMDSTRSAHPAASGPWHVHPSASGSYGYAHPTPTSPLVKSQTIGSGMSDFGVSVGGSGSHVRFGSNRGLGGELPRRGEGGLLSPLSSKGQYYGMTESAMKSLKRGGAKDKRAHRKSVSGSMSGSASGHGHGHGHGVFHFPDRFASGSGSGSGRGLMQRTYSHPGLSSLGDNGPGSSQVGYDDTRNGEVEREFEDGSERSFGHSGTYTPRLSSPQQSHSSSPHHILLHNSLLAATAKGAKRLKNKTIESLTGSLSGSVIGDEEPEVGRFETQRYLNLQATRTRRGENAEQQEKWVREGVGLLSEWTLIVEPYKIGFMKSKDPERLFEEEIRVEGECQAKVESRRGRAGVVDDSDPEESNGNGDPIEDVDGDDGYERRRGDGRGQRRARDKRGHAERREMDKDEDDLGDEDSDEEDSNGEQRHRGSDQSKTQTSIGDKRKTSPHRYLFHCYVYQYHLIQIAVILIEMLDEMIRLEEERVECKLWTPVDKLFGFLGGWGETSIVDAENMEDDDPDYIQGLHHGHATSPSHSPSESPNGNTPLHHSHHPHAAYAHHVHHEHPHLLFDLNLPHRRDPDALPPRNLFEALMNALYELLISVRGGNMQFALKAGVLSVLLCLPFFLKSSAQWAYQNRFFWAVVMGQLTLARFRGDTTFGLTARIISTFFGGLTGMVLWYISAGSGHGNPYALAATLLVCSPFFYFARLYWPIPQMTNIVFFVTAVLVIGYSYQDTILVAPGSPGSGWNVAWRRFVFVAIGVFAAFIFSYFPPATTIRRYQRHLLSTTTSELGSIYCSILTFANTKHEPEIQEIIRGLIAVRAKLNRGGVMRVNVGYEFSLRGRWPRQRYQKIADLQMAISYSLGHLMSVIEHLEPAWARAFLRRTRFMDPDFQGDVLAVISMVSSCLRNGTPLPQVTPCPLQDRFMLRYHELEVIHKEAEEDYGLPRIMTLETLKDEQYMIFCVGVSTAFAIVNRLDRLMIAAKELLGEHYHIHGIGVSGRAVMDTLPPLSEMHSRASYGPFGEDIREKERSNRVNFDDVEKGMTKG